MYIPTIATVFALLLPLCRCIVKQTSGSNDVQDTLHGQPSSKSGTSCRTRTRPHLQDQYQHRRQTRKYADVRQRAICAEHFEEVLNTANPSDQRHIQDASEDTNQQDIAAAIKDQSTNEKASGRDQNISFNHICEKTILTNWCKSITV